MPGAGGTVDAGGDDTGGGIVFQLETGNLATPTHASLQQFLSPKVVADFPKRGADPDVNGSNAVWNYHKYITTTEKETGAKPGTPGKYLLRAIYASQSSSISVASIWACFAICVFLGAGTTISTCTSTGHRQT